MLQWYSYQASLKQPSKKETLSIHENVISMPGSLLYIGVLNLLGARVIGL